MAVLRPHSNFHTDEKLRTCTPWYALLLFVGRQQTQPQLSTWKDDPLLAEGGNARSITRPLTQSHRNPPSYPFYHTHCRSPTCSCTHSLTNSFTQTHTHTHTHTHIHTHTHAHTHTHTHTRTRTRTHTHTRAHAHSLPCLPTHAVTHPLVQSNSGYQKPVRQIHCHGLRIGT